VRCRGSKGRMTPSITGKRRANLEESCVYLRVASENGVSEGGRRETQTKRVWLAQALISMLF